MSLYLYGALALGAAFLGLLGWGTYEKHRADAESAVNARWESASRQVQAQHDAALAAAGVRLRGAELLSGLAALCAVPAAAGGEPPAGSLTDIADTGRKQVAHSWHCDSGLRVNTILMARACACCRDEAKGLMKLLSAGVPGAR